MWWYIRQLLGIKQLMSDEVKLQEVWKYALNVTNLAIPSFLMFIGPCIILIVE